MEMLTAQFTVAKGSELRKTVSSCESEISELSPG
jgi:hypothetical protein